MSTGVIAELDAAHHAAQQELRDLENQLREVNNILREIDSDYEADENEDIEGEDSSGEDEESEDNHSLVDYHSQEVAPTTYHYCKPRDCWSRPVISPLCFTRVRDEDCPMIQHLRKPPTIYTAPDDNSTMIACACSLIFVVGYFIAIAFYANYDKIYQNIYNYYHPRPKPSPINIFYLIFKFLLQCFTNMYNYMMALPVKKPSNIRPSNIDVYFHMWNLWIIFAVYFPYTYIVTPQQRIEPPEDEQNEKKYIVKLPDNRVRNLALVFGVIISVSLVVYMVITIYNSPFLRSLTKVLFLYLFFIAYVITGIILVLRLMYLCSPRFRQMWQRRNRS